MAKGNDKDFRAKVIARAWKDPQFKQKLLKNPKTALKEMGFEIPANIEVRVLEDKQNSFTFVLPPASAQTGELSNDEIERIAGGGWPSTLWFFCD